MKMYLTTSSRFYSTNSSFVHGGSERKGGATDGPVYGQQDIHARITQVKQLTSSIWSTYPFTGFFFRHFFGMDKQPLAENLS